MLAGRADQRRDIFAEKTFTLSYFPLLLFLTHLPKRLFTRGLPLANASHGAQIWRDAFLVAIFLLNRMKHSQTQNISRADLNQDKKETDNSASVYDLITRI